VRHDLTVPDGLVVVVRGAIDGTVAIQEAPAAQGLPIAIVDDEAPPSAAGHTADANWFIWLDAADLLNPASRAALWKALAETDGRWRSPFHGRRTRPISNCHRPTRWQHW